MNEVQNDPNFLIEKNVRLVNKIIRKYMNRVSLSEDEIRSIANEGLVKAAHTYNPQKAKFSTHACVTMSGAVTHDIQAKKQKKRSLYRTVSYYSELSNKNKDTNSELIEVIPLEDDFTYVIVEDFLNRLKENEKQVLRGMLNGDRNVEIARDMGYSLEGIRRIKKKIKEKYSNLYGR